MTPVSRAVTVFVFAKANYRHSKATKKSFSYIYINTVGKYTLIHGVLFQSINFWSFYSFCTSRTSMHPVTHELKALNAY